jgi:cysteinyl-tRNA synthetase
MSLQFYNSLARRVVPFVPREDGKVGMYTCGPTVYNYAHIGNYRAYTFEDLLRRTLRFLGYEVTQVMNITDVDDKTIRDSQRAGMSLAAFTAKYKEAFFADLATLRIEPAEHYPAATEHIPEMITLVQTLVEKGYAYRADDGSVYFSIARFPAYGQLVNLDPEQLRASGRVKHDEYAKEAIADFALWKAYDPEDGNVGWDSPWGRGRPGWHIECSAMSMKYLGPTFDIHTGGVDNMFPHHEDEIAQSEAANGCTFVNYWLHCAHLVVDGEKMSKSLGNFYTLRDVQKQGFNGREIRFVLLSTHYRQKLNFSFQACRDAKATLQRIDDFVNRLKLAADTPDHAAATAAEEIARCDAEFAAALADDLNTSAALAALFNLVRSFNKLLDAGAVSKEDAGRALDLLRRLDTVLGVLDIDREEEIPHEVLAQAEARQQARQQKDFARADTIRDTLREQGWIIEDTPAGPRVKRA